jgi:RNA polymerase sigma-70 factor (ECF subfamily)
MPVDLEIIWPQIHDALRGFIAKRVRDQADADDILQEVFLRIQRGLDGLKDSRKLLSWLYQIARRAVVDHYRQPARRREQPAGLAIDLEGSVGAEGVPRIVADQDSSEVRAELAGCLRPMIERLSSRYQSVVTMVELEGLTAKAAARRLRLSESGVKSRVQRGRTQLKAMLETCCAFQFDGRRRVRDYSRRGTDCSSCR